MRDQSGNYLAVIKVVGVGGGGSNAVNRLISARLPLEAVEQAVDGLRTGTALRTVLDLDGTAA